MNFPCGAKDVFKSQYLELRVGVVAGLHCFLYLLCQLKRENGDWPMGVAGAPKFNFQWVSGEINPALMTFPARKHNRQSWTQHATTIKKPSLYWFDISFAVFLPVTGADLACEGIWLWSFPHFCKEHSVTCWEPKITPGLHVTYLKRNYLLESSEH